MSSAAETVENASIIAESASHDGNRLWIGNIDPKITEWVNPVQFQLGIYFMYVQKSSQPASFTRQLLYTAILKVSALLIFIEIYPW